MLPSPPITSNMSQYRALVLIAAVFSASRTHKSCGYVSMRVPVFRAMSDGPMTMIGTPGNRDWNKRI